MEILTEVWINKDNDWVSGLLIEKNESSYKVKINDDIILTDIIKKKNMMILIIIII